MSDTAVENFENEGGASAPEATESTEAPTTQSEDWRGPSKEEWGYAVSALRYLAERGAFNDGEYAEDDPEEEEDLEGLSMGELVERYVDRRLGEVKPAVEASVQERGEKRFNEMMDQLEVFCCLS